MTKDRFQLELLHWFSWRLPLISAAIALTYHGLAELLSQLAHCGWNICPQHDNPLWTSGATIVLLLALAAAFSVLRGTYILFRDMRRRALRSEADELLARAKEFELSPEGRKFLRPRRGGRRPSSDQLYSRAMSAARSSLVTREDIDKAEKHLRWAKGLA